MPAQRTNYSRYQNFTGVNTLHLILTNIAIICIIIASLRKNE